MSVNEKVVENIEDAFKTLAQQRDELHVKIHLGEMEVRDKWAELENQWEQLIIKKEQLQHDLEPTAMDARIAWLMLKDEIAEGYRIIRDRM